MTDPATPPQAVGGTRRPLFGDEPIDAALTELDDLAERPLAEHHDRLVRAHEALHDALERRDDADPTGARPA